MKKLLLTTVLAAVMGGASLTVVTGCATQKPVGSALATPPAIEPRPTNLTVVPQSAVRVAVLSGTGGFTKPVERGQRWYLVDETGNTLIKSDIAAKDGDLQVSPDSAKLNGRTVWSGDAKNVSSLALYLSDTYEKP